MRFVVAMVAALTVKELFVVDAAADLQQFEDAVEKGIPVAESAAGGRYAAREAMAQWKLHGIAGGGDLAALLFAVGAADHVRATSAAADGGSDLALFCAEKSLRLKAVLEVMKLRSQLARIDSGFGGTADEQEARLGPVDASLTVLKPPTEKQLDATRQIILAGFGDCVCRLSRQITPEMARLGVIPYDCPGQDEPVYIHPSSVLAKQKPELVVYHELVCDVTVAARDSCPPSPAARRSTPLGAADATPLARVPHFAVRARFIGGKDGLAHRADA
jgi:ATP-dependent RNA helicase DHX37/DHR1